MKVGVLMCAHVDEDLQEEVGGDYDVLYGDFLRLADPSIEAVGYDAIGGELPSSPDECDLWVITGSPADSFSDEPWVDELRAFVRSVHEHRSSLLGVCFGHQIVAEALGGKVERASEWKVGPGVVHLDHTDWWSGGDVTIPGFHQDIVVETPPGAEVIGASRRVPVGAMRLGDHILTIQNHPEFAPGYFEDLLERRGDGLPHDVLVDARERNHRSPHDATAVSAWVKAFFDRDRTPDA